MARVSTYLNFMGTTEEAFSHYANVFGTEAKMLQRFSEVNIPEHKNLTPEERNGIMHIELPILAGHSIMATDMIASMGHSCEVGNNTSISLEFDSVDEARQIYERLAEGSTDCMPIQEMPWGAYWGVALDRFGIRWMFSAPITTAAK